jgi:hypothetical protein
VANYKSSSGGFASWVPLAYEGRLRITTEKKAGFYIAQYDTFPPDWQIPSGADGGDVVRLRAMFADATKDPAPGETSRGATALDVGARGAGTLTRVRFEPDPAAGPPDLAHARIVIAFDGAGEGAGAEAAQVDVPLGAFFGCGLGPASVHAIPFTMTERVYENRFPMPFWHGFHAEVRGAAGVLSVRIDPPRWTEAEAGTFTARTNAHPARRGEDFEYVDLEGAGKIVGTVLTIRPGPEVKKWWEGDLRDTIDGARTPAMHGTGHEDDHLGGWSNEFFERPFSLPLHGEPKTEILDHTGQYNANVSLYRLWPGIAFGRRVVHSVEHGSENRVMADYAGVTFAYVKKPPPDRGPALVMTDAVDVDDAASRARHAYTASRESDGRALRSTFEGRAYKTAVTARHRAAEGEARFRLSIDPKNRGVKLRRMFDQRDAEQRATVMVDGLAVGDWYVSLGNRRARWAERDYFLPSRVTAGKRTIEVRLVPDGDLPWDAARYEAWVFEE